MIFNVKAFYVFFIVIMIASMGAVGLGVGSTSNVEPPPIIDATTVPSATPANAVFDGPVQVIDATQPHVATLTTNKGDIQIELATDVPDAVNNFVFLAGKSFYDGTAMYYVDHDFIAQGGDPNCSFRTPVPTPTPDPSDTPAPSRTPAPTGRPVCNGFGDPGYTIPLETSAATHEKWVVAFPAASTAGQVHGSQFRIYFQPDARLDNKETIFGTVTEGQDILESLSELEICTALTVESDTCVDELPTDALTILDVSVEEA